MKLEKILRKGIFGLGFIATIGLPMRISAQEIPQNLMIPSEYNNYKQHFMQPCYNIKLGDYYFHVHDYDIDQDKTMDVSELYPLPIQSKVPLFYGFDLNNNNMIEDDEIIIDKEMDGWNGNEEWLVPKSLEKKINGKKYLTKK